MSSIPKPTYYFHLITSYYSPLKNKPMNKLLALAISIAANGFKDRLDRGGVPYILHCLWVMNKMDTDEEKIVGVLHDVPEDDIMTIEELRSLGFSSSLLYSLELLNHHSDEDYMDYIKKIAVNPMARKVKMADLHHNSDITRIKGLTKKDLDRVEKYHRAYTYLSKI